MRDIVAELRSLQGSYGGSGQHDAGLASVLKRAADEIERLRADAQLLAMTKRDMGPPLASRAYPNPFSLK